MKKAGLDQPDHTETPTSPQHTHTHTRARAHKHTRQALKLLLVGGWMLSVVLLITSHQVKHISDLWVQQGKGKLSVALLYTQTLSHTHLDSHNSSLSHPN